MHQTVLTTLGDCCLQTSTMSLKSNNISYAIQHELYPLYEYQV